MFRHRTQSRPEGEGEQSYMGSAADLMTGLLFVFIIMVAFLALQKKSEQEAEKPVPPQPNEPGIGYAPPGFPVLAWPDFGEWMPWQSGPGQKPPVPKEHAGGNDPRGEVTRAIGNEIRDILPTITIDEASGVITLPEELLFARGSAELKDSAVSSLEQISLHLPDVLKCYVANQRMYQGRPYLNCPNNPDGHEIDTIFIEGHTDSVPNDKPGGNLGLSLERAKAVHDVLVRGKPLASFKNKNEDPIFSQAAYGESRPLLKTDTTHAKNRRVDLRIVLTYRPPATGGPINAAQSAVR